MAHNIEDRELETIRTRDGGQIKRLIEADGTSEQSWHVDKDNRVMELHRNSTPDKLIPAYQGETHREMTMQEREFLSQRSSDVRFHKTLTPEEVAIRQGVERQSYTVSSPALPGREYNTWDRNDAMTRADRSSRMQPHLAVVKNKGTDRFEGAYVNGQSLGNDDKIIRERLATIADHIQSKTRPEVTHER